MRLGWIKLHRSLRDWQYYSDKNATRLLIHLLISVNHEDKKWRGFTIKAGSMVFSWDTLSASVGLTVKQTRVAMSKLENSSEVARNRVGKGQVVSLVKWEELQYEGNNMADNLAGKGQEKGRKRATTKESKEIKETKNKEYYSLVENCFDRCIEFFPDQLRPDDNSKWIDTIDKLKK